MKSIIAWLVFAASCFGQITVKPEYEPFEPIVITFDLKPGPNVELLTTTRASEKLRLIDVPGGAHGWAPPGEQWIEITGIRQEFREIVILVPDPEFPDDLTKLKREKIKLYSPATIVNYRATFKVKGSIGPAPGPVPVIPDPSPAVQAVFAPVKAIVGRAEPAKAALWASAWGDFLLAVQAAPPKSTGEFKGALTAFLNAAAVKGGLQGAFPGFSAEIERVFVTTFGAADGALDQAKARAFVEAIVWACLPAKVAFNSHSSSRYE